MNQLAINFESPAYFAQFDGKTYEPEQDFTRLNTQLRAVRDLMRDGTWRSLNQIAVATGYPEASLSARLRDLRKLKFGLHTVQRRRAGEGRGTFEYRVLG
jgi:hypothetical protein